MPGVLIPDLIGIPKAAYHQSADPAVANPTHLRTGIWWVDTTSSPYVLKRRNAANDGWDTIGKLRTDAEFNTDVDGRITAANLATDAELADAIADHEAAPDPHPGYLTETEADALYEPLGGGGGGATYSGASAYHILPFHPNSLGTIANSANEIKAFRFFLPHGLTVAQVSIHVGTLFSGGLCSIAVYSADGSTLHLDSGTFSTTTTGVKTNTLGSPVTLPAGFYWLAWTQDNGTSRFSGTGWNNVTIGALYNAGTFQVGESVTTSAGAVMPSAISPVSTTGSTTPIPVVKLQG